MSGRKMKEARRTGEVISLDAKRAEREFEKLVKAAKETRLERNFKRREFTRKVAQVVTLAAFAAAMIGLVVFAVLH